jgi:hypothetical protein
MFGCALNGKLPRCAMCGYWTKWEELLSCSVQWPPPMAFIPTNLLHLCQALSDNFFFFSCPFPFPFPFQHALSTITSQFGSVTHLTRTLSSALPTLLYFLSRRSPVQELPNTLDIWQFDSLPNQELWT